MTNPRTKVDNDYTFYRKAAVKAGQHDDRQQLASGLSLAEDIYDRETWRVFVEEILPADHRPEFRTVRNLPTETKGPVVVPIVEHDAPKVASFLKPVSLNKEEKKMTKPLNPRAAFWDPVGARQLRAKQPPNRTKEPGKFDNPFAAVGLTDAELAHWQEMQERNRRYLASHPDAFGGLKNRIRWIL
jgi:hypothetical protein